MEIKKFKRGYGSGEKIVEAIQFTEDSKNTCNHFVTGVKTYEIDSSMLPVLGFLEGDRLVRLTFGDWVVKDESAPIDFRCQKWTEEEFETHHKEVTNKPI